MRLESELKVTRELLDLAVKALATISYLPYDIHEVSKGLCISALEARIGSAKHALTKIAEGLEGQKDTGKGDEE